LCATSTRTADRATENAQRADPLPALDVVHAASREIRGSVVYADGSAQRIHTRAADGDIDPTGAGDAFAVAYLAARSAGHMPSGAARRASSLVVQLLAGPRRRR